MEENQVLYYARFAVAGAVLAAAAFFVLPAGVSFLAGVVFLGALATGYYLKSQRLKGMEENFRIFLDDLRDLLQAGVSITDAIELTAHNDYGPLSTYVKRLAAQVKLGIPFEKAMNHCFGRLHSSMIRRIVLVINQTLRAGGNFMKVFATSTDYVEKIERLSRERKMRTLSVISNAYLMFFVFVFIVVGIQVYFLPLLQDNPTNVGALLGGGAPEALPQGGLDVDFSGHFLNMVIVQAVFAGPMIGKIAENDALAGIKHSIVLLASSLTIYVTALSLLAPEALA